MALNFPSTTGQPTDGSFTYTAGGITWIWDGLSWRSGISSGGESDPVYSSSAASNVTNQKIQNWDAAFSWGDHSQAGYGSGSGGGSMNELVDDTTPQLGGVLDCNGFAIDFGANVITDADVGNYDTAYGWGDHSAAGYLTSLPAIAIGSLSDVTISTPSAGQVLKYNGSAWINDTAAAGLSNIVDSAQGVNVTGKVATTDGMDIDIGGGINAAGTSIDFQNATISFSGASIGGLSGTIHDAVDFHLNQSTATDGQVLSWNATGGGAGTGDYEWVNQSGGGSASSPLVAPETFDILVTGATNTYYTISGDDRYGEVGGNDVPVRMYTGDTVTFNTTALSGSHPLYIRVSDGGASVSNPAATGEGTSSISWTPSATGTYYYQCSSHPGMLGIIYVEDPVNADPTITVKNTNIQGEWAYSQSNDFDIQSLGTAGAIPGHNTAKYNLPQYMPTYTDTAGSLPPISNPPDHPDPVSCAFDARYDTWLNVASSVDNGVIELTFTNPVLVDQLYELTFGYDGNVQPGYNGANYVTNTTTTGDIQEITIKAAGSGSGLQLDKLSFKTVTASGATGRLYYVIASFGGSTGMMVYKSSKVGIGNAGRKFYRHDSSVNLQLGAEHLNSIIGVNTYIPRSLVLPIHYMCRDGDTITVMDLGVGRLDKDSTDDFANALNAGYGTYDFNPGNATNNPISIFPSLEQGIQQTGVYAKGETFQNSSSEVFWLPTTVPSGSPNNKYYYSGWHGMPFVLNRSGQSITFVFCGGLYGWRVLS